MTYIERLKQLEEQAHEMTDAELMQIVTAPASTESKQGFVTLGIQKAARNEIISRWMQEHEQKSE